MHSLPRESEEEEDAHRGFDYLGDAFCDHPDVEEQVCLREDEEWLHTELNPNTPDDAQDTLERGLVTKRGCRGKGLSKRDSLACACE
jgi:hypothetical protein